MNTAPNLRQIPETVSYVMDYYHLPKQINTYNTDLYSKLNGRVETQNWKTEIFNFLKGVFQGDPFSGVIFLEVFNPLLEYIKQNKETRGYELKTKKLVLSL